MIYALDTNIISYSIKKRYGINEKIRQVLIHKIPIVIPPITYYEALRVLLAVKAGKQLALLNQLCQQLNHKEMEREDWIEAARLYAAMVQKGHPMGDSDLIKAAFCLRNQYVLVTHNTKHFSHLTNLVLEDWVQY